MKNKKSKDSTKSHDKDVVTRDTNLAQLVNKFPFVAEVLLDYDLHCVGCGFSSMDSIEAGAKAHGYNDEEVREIVVKVNELLETEKLKI